jgi:hypothetical protein
MHASDLKKRSIDGVFGRSLMLGVRNWGRGKTENLIDVIQSFLSTMHVIREQNRMKPITTEILLVAFQMPQVTP